MKKQLLKILSVFIVLISLSCTVNNSSNESSNTEVWEEGISTLTGTITKVTPEKDGQSLVLMTQHQIEYNLIVSIPNLGDNAAQYRKFEVGEYISFKGNLLDNRTLIVREVLETR